MDETTAIRLGLSPIDSKEVCARFAGGRLSSDGGVLVLREIEKRLGLGRAPCRLLDGCARSGEHDSTATPT